MSVAEPLMAVNEGVKLLQSLAGEMKRWYGAARARIAPDYGAAAEGFHELSKLLRASFWEIDRTVSDVIYLPWAGSKQEKLEERLKTVQETPIDKLASQMKFACGEIADTYRDKCEGWLKQFLGVNNEFAKRIADQKQGGAEQILKKMTEIDAMMLRALIDGIVKPLNEFAIEASKKTSVAEIENLLDGLRPRLAATLVSIRENLSLIDDAVASFRELARGAQRRDRS